MTTPDDDAKTLIHVRAARSDAEDAPTVPPPPAYPARYLPSPRVAARIPLSSWEPRHVSRDARLAAGQAPVPVVARREPPSTADDTLSARQRLLLTLLAAVLAAMAGSALGSALVRGGGWREAPPGAWSSPAPASAKEPQGPRPRCD